MITEDIITDLSKVSTLNVLSRNTTFAFKGKSVDAAQLVMKLKVGLRRGRQCAQGRWARAHHCATYRREHGQPRLGRALRPRAERYLSLCRMRFRKQSSRR